MDCASQRSSEPSCTSAPTAAAWALLLEASGDSESDEIAAAAADGSSAFDADDGDAESCSGGDDGSMELEDGRRLVSWQCWMVDSATSMVVVGGEVACPPLSTEDAGGAESDRLFWEACIAHGY